MTFINEFESTCVKQELSKVPNNSIQSFIRLYSFDNQLVFKSLLNEYRQTYKCRVNHGAKGLLQHESIMHSKYPKMTLQSERLLIVHLIYSEMSFKERTSSLFELIDSECLGYIPRFSPAFQKCISAIVEITCLGIFEAYYLKKDEIMTESDMITLSEMNKEIRKKA